MDARMEGQLVLPDPPATESGRVQAWKQAVTMRTYMPDAPDRNPMFLEKRVYQGSSGKVYPLGFVDRIATEAVEHEWEAVHLQNEYVRLMTLPEIGGRIHVGLDRTNGYDFFYRQNVIKPALVGLAGPWISGGVEFNWPQHHRPATFLPVDVEIERGGDGSVTVWCSDHDPLTRMKGMHGVCLHPGRAVVELKVRLYNRTPLMQTFLWWANVAVRVHERYQSFFPGDVRYVADHAKRAVTSFPLSDRPYYGVDYAARAREGVPAEEMPAQFRPDGSYEPNDLSWYANIPVPTSYMIVNTEGNFFGGYDHAARAGVVHVADPHIAPGKKQWTWGNHEFGYAWDRNLTDDDGPYVELMAGVYTDNQPDFSFLAPGETKTFSQYWFPIREIGPVQAASQDAAVSLRRTASGVRVGVCVTRPLAGARIVLSRDGAALHEWWEDLQVERAFIADVDLGREDGELSLLIEAEGAEILRATTAKTAEESEPEVATETPLPYEIESLDELYLTGVHLEQYRHATRQPELYWQEALRRDGGDARCNNALGLWRLRRGEFAEAERHFATAIERLTRRNPNPRDGEPHYNLGLALRYQGRDAEAYSAFAKAAWNAAWRAPAYYALAEMDARSGKWVAALDHVQHCLASERDHLNARNLRGMVLRQLGRSEDAEAELGDTIALDPLDNWSRYLRTGSEPPSSQQALDLAFDLERAGFDDDAVKVLRGAEAHVSLGAEETGARPMLLYAMAWLLQQAGDTNASADAYEKAVRCNSDWCFPSRLEELKVLEWAVGRHPRDGRAAFYLGNLLYDRRRHAEAITQWERAVDVEATNATAWRNLGIAYFNVNEDAERARTAFENAFAANPEDARVLYERDQLWKRMGVSAERRLLELGRFPALCAKRDDLAVEVATLLNQTGKPDQALALLMGRKFQPWEGGEGLALAQYGRAQFKLGHGALARRDAEGARSHYQAILEPPHNLGEARHLLANDADVWFWTAESFAQEGQEALAVQCWRRAALQRGDFQQMSVRVVSDKTFWSAMAWSRLGEGRQAGALLAAMLDQAAKLEQEEARIDYFATSLPAMLLFEEDLNKRNQIEALFLRGQAHLGLGDTAEAEQCLRAVLAMDSSHSGAADLLEERDLLGLVKGGVH